MVFCDIYILHASSMDIHPVLFFSGAVALFIISNIIVAIIIDILVAHIGVIALLERQRDVLVSDLSLLSGDAIRVSLTRGVSVTSRCVSSNNRSCSGGLAIAVRTNDVRELAALGLTRALLREVGTFADVVLVTI